MALRTAIYLACVVGAASRLQHSSQPRAVNLAAFYSSASTTGGLYGDDKCKCIGLDNVVGEVAMATGATKTMYPAEAGASCEAWDKKRAPECDWDSLTQDGPVPAYCHQPWCYVDPCKCDIATTPVVSAYLPDARYQGKPVHYSYQTCGGQDAYTSKHHQKACVNQKSAEACGALDKCAWNGQKCASKQVMGMCAAEADETKFGKKGCQCVGIDKLEGYLEATVDGQKLKFPGDYGSTCKTWEMDTLEKCKGPNPPKYCDKAWCWVDPCSCNEEEPPKVNAGWVDGKPSAISFQGKTVYYSYTACGSEDLFTEKHHPSACVNQKSAAACGALSKCAWNGKRCLGRELAETCPAAKAAPPPPVFYSGSQARAPLLALVLMMLPLAGRQ